MSKKKEKHAGGRPSKYRHEYCAVLLDLMSKGKQIAHVAKALDVCRDTLYEWASQHEEFSDALSKGRDASEAWWADLLQAQALGKIGGAFVPSIFVLKSRFKWSERLEVAHSIDDEDDADDLFDL